MSVYRVKPNIGRLHVIITDDNGGRPTRSGIELAKCALQGGADTIQFRRKHGTIRSMIEEGRIIQSLCRERKVPLIVNDRVDLCLAIDADGVHLGEFDMPVEDGRRVLGSYKIIGATVRNRFDLQHAYNQSADYVGCGPVFTTTTKKLPIEPLGISGLSKVTIDSPIPVIAIAGINESNARDVLSEGGAWGIAVVGIVSAAKNPTAIVQSLSDTIATTKTSL